MPDYVQLELPLGPEFSAAAGGSEPAGRQETARLLRIADGRAKLIELLYEADGRADPSHPQHGFYTGLGEQHHRAVGQAVVELVLAQEDCDPECLVLTGTAG